jgi:hypothetical protein
MLLRRLCLLAALCLLGSGAANAAVPVSVTSAYGIGLSTAVVTNLRDSNSVTCNFANNPKLICQIQGVLAKDNLRLVVTAKSGYVVTGGTGQCEGVTAGAFQFQVPDKGANCGIAWSASRPPTDPIAPWAT